jgi:predicted ATPase
MAVVEICRRLDGLPLALGSPRRARLLEPVALLARLERVSTLGAGPIDCPSVNAPLRKLSSGAWTGCAAELLSTLSVFADG